ncbi:MAG: hypothetical protein ACFCVD_19135 [Nodosilinea sp.]
MHYSTWLTATILLGASGVSLPALANTTADLQPKPLSMVDMLVTEQHNPDSLNRLAERLNLQIRAGDDDTTTITDALQSPLLDGLVDENGDVNLPLGLTVFDAMGATSVGFGSKF